MAYFNSAMFSDKMFYEQSDNQCVFIVKLLCLSDKKGSE